MRDISSPLDGIASPFGPQRTKTLTQLLFASSEPGFTFEPWDITTLYQDRAGTTPVTAAGQSVGLRLSKDQGLRIGSDVVLNGDFSTNSTANWTEAINGGTLNASTGQLVVNNTAGTGNTGVYQVRSCTANAFMRVSVEVTARTEARLAIFNGTLGATIYSNNALPVGTSTFIVGPMLSGTFTVYIHCSAGNTATFDNISVRELAGNHEVAVSDAKRGVYGWMPKTGKRNLLTYTEQFDNAAWVKTAASVPATNGTAPDGTATADTLREDGTNNTHVAQQNPSASALTAYTISIYFKREAGTRNAYIQVNNNITGTGGACFAWFDLTGSGTASSVTDLVPGFTSTGASITSVGSGWYRCAIRLTTISGTTSLGVYLGAYNAARSYTGDGTSGILIWGAQLETGSTATAYQRVVSQYDITEAGVPTCYYVQADGVDDAYVTPTITPGTDKAQVFVGVRKLSDALAMVVESSADFTLNNGTIAFYTFTDFRFGSKGTSSQVALGGPSAPSTCVATGIGDVSGDSAILRLNGAQTNQNTGDQGTGNFLAYPAYIYGRAGTSFPFNGLDFGHAVRFGPNLDAATIARVESLIARNTPEVTL